MSLEVLPSSQCQPCQGHHPVPPAAFRAGVNQGNKPLSCSPCTSIPPSSFPCLCAHTNVPASMGCFGLGSWADTARTLELHQALPGGAEHSQHGCSVSSPSCSVGSPLGQASLLSNTWGAAPSWGSHLKQVSQLLPEHFIHGFLPGWFVPVGVEIWWK